MRQETAVRGHREATEATRGPDAYPDKGARFMDALRPRQRVIRIGKPPRGPRRPISTAIDLATTAAHGLLAATAIIFAIGG